MCIAKSQKNLAMNLIELIIDNIIPKLNKNDLFKLALFSGISFLTNLIIRELDYLSIKYNYMEIMIISMILSSAIIAIVIYLLRVLYKVRKNVFIISTVIIILSYAIFFFGICYALETLIVLYLLLFIVIGLNIIWWIANKF